MGLLTEALADVRSLMGERNVTSWSGVSQYVAQSAAFSDGKYETYAREGYQTNALVYACIEELATSAAEPRMQVRIRGQKWKHEHPLLTLLERPNPFMDHFEFWATVILHRSLAGNAYALKVRSRSGKVVELWLLRPDRVRIVPSAETFIARYEYHLLDGAPIPLPVDDIIHFKTRHPIDQFYGMPPLMPIAGVVDIDNYMRDFVGTYFARAGVPAGMLSTKTKLTEELKHEIKTRFSRDYGGREGWHGMMVIDGTEASFTAMTRDLGAQGLVLPELNKIVEARITGAFGVPATIVGAVIGSEASSYGNKKSERESFWNETLKPLYRELAGPINMRLAPDFSGVAEVAFDLSTVGALREDDDAVHARARADLMAGGISVQEFREITGREPEIPEGTFLIPSNLTATPADKVWVPAEPEAALSARPAAPEPAVPASNGSR
jgi:HK97 family phage portal protein